MGVEIGDCDIEILWRRIRTGYLYIQSEVSICPYMTPNAGARIGGP